jgi:hypothetical protein
MSWRGEQRGTALHEEGVRASNLIARLIVVAPATRLVSKNCEGPRTADLRPRLGSQRSGPDQMQLSLSSVSKIVRFSREPIADRNTTHIGGIHARISSAALRRRRNLAAILLPCVRQIFARR